MTDTVAKKIIKRWSDEEDKQLLDEIEKGLKIPEIAKNHDRSYNAIVMHLCGIAEHLINNHGFTISKAQKKLKLVAENEIENFILKQKEKKDEQEKAKAEKEANPDKFKKKREESKNNNPKVGPENQGAEISKFQDKINELEKEVFEQKANINELNKKVAKLEELLLNTNEGKQKAKVCKKA